MTAPDSSTASDLGGIKQDLINSFDCSLDRVVAMPVRTSRLHPNHVIPRPARMEHNKVNVTVDPNVSHEPSSPQICPTMSCLRRGEHIELDQGPPARCGSTRNAKCRDCVRQARWMPEMVRITSAAVRQTEPSKSTEVRRAGDRGPRAEDRYLRGLNLRTLVKDHAPSTLPRRPDGAPYGPAPTSGQLVSNQQWRPYQ
jgi:hypothetical protein